MKKTYSGYYKESEVSESKVRRNYKQQEETETLKDVEGYQILAVPFRGITEEAAKYFGIRSAVSQEDGRSIVATYYPYRDKHGKITGYKKRDWTKQKEEKGHITVVGVIKISNQLFGQHQVDLGSSRKKLIQLEGEDNVVCAWQSILDNLRDNTKNPSCPKAIKDYLGAIEAGILWGTEGKPTIGVVGLSLGTANSAETIANNEKFVRSFDEYVLALDNDSANEHEALKGIMKGKEATDAIATFLLAENVYSVVWPDERNDPHGLNDPRDFVEKGRYKELAQLLTKCTNRYVPDKVISLSDLSIEDLRKKKKDGIPLPMFPELYEKTKGPRKGELWVATGPSGAGKCHGKDTPILMFDASIKLVQDIKQGDILMGADGTPRRVLNTVKGRESLYKIRQTKGEDYVVNESHILSLHCSTDFGSKGIKYKKGEIVNIGVMDYLNESKTFKAFTKGYKADLTHLAETTVSNPYLLGLWLADGSSADSRITVYKQDTELLDYLRNKEHGYEIYEHDTTDKNNCFLINIKGGFRELLKNKQLKNNKHIPLEYKTASYKQRLELLAGILDGDGYLYHNGYEIVSKFPALAEDIVYLARSIGLQVTVKDKFSKCQNFKGAYYKRLFIYGDTAKIPCKLQRKQAKPRQQVKNSRVTGIKLEELGLGDYYGFQLDGDHLYCLGDFTVTHNTTLCRRIEYCIAEYLMNEENPKLEDWTEDEKIGIIHLEEDEEESVNSLYAIELGVDEKDFVASPEEFLTEEEHMEIHRRWIDKDKVRVFDHFGSIPVQDLISKLKHMVYIDGCKWIILDHLSIVISGLGLADERKGLDEAMTALATFCKQYNVFILAIAHMKRTDFQPPKTREGEDPKPYWIPVRKEQLRGSAALEQLGWVILAVEPEELPNRERGRIRWVCLKNRPHKKLGVCDTMFMDAKGKFVDASTWEFSEGNYTGEGVPVKEITYKQTPEEY